MHSERAAADRRGFDRQKDDLESDQVGESPHNEATEGKHPDLLEVVPPDLRLGSGLGLGLEADEQTTNKALFYRKVQPSTNPKRTHHLCDAEQKAKIKARTLDESELLRTTLHEDSVEELLVGNHRRHNHVLQVEHLLDVVLDVGHERVEKLRRVVERFENRLVLDGLGQALPHTLWQLVRAHVRDDLCE